MSKNNGPAAETADVPVIPAVIFPRASAPVITTKDGTFDLENPILPDWVEDRALTSGGYPYKKRLKGKSYANELRAVQIELVKLQRYVTDPRLRIVALFEGRDAAGKGGSIKTLTEFMNPRIVRTVALPKPTDREAGQWYFQRYVDQFPAGGEMVLFDRSWYNRAGVERVMGFCSEAETKSFLAQAPDFERMLVDDGILLFKFWLNIGRETQLKRFHARRHNPLKIWKLSPVDFAALARWDAYTQARDEMFATTHTEKSPWMVVRGNDKHRARINVARHVLNAVEYPGKDAESVGLTDPKIIGSPSLLA